MSELNPKRQSFVEEYLKDLNGTQAAIRAGYSAHTANEQAARLLADASIQEAIQIGKQKRTERTEISSDRVLKKLWDIAERTPKNDPSWENYIRALELIGKHVGMFDKGSTGEEGNLLALAQAIRDSVNPPKPE